MTSFGGELLKSAFPGDDGTADPALIDALEALLAEPSPAARGKVLDLLASARLLVPVVARVTELGADGADKTSEIAAVTFRSRDGRLGQPAFSGIAALHEWDPAARPVPQWAAQVAAATLAAGMDGLLIDLASRHRLAVTGLELARLAAQRPGAT